jgi:hypothetical protein
MWKRKIGPAEYAKTADDQKNMQEKAGRILEF